MLLDILYCRIFYYTFGFSFLNSGFAYSYAQGQLSFFLV